MSFSSENGNEEYIRDAPVIGGGGGGGDGGGGGGGSGDDEKPMTMMNFGSLPTFD